MSFGVFSAHGGVGASDSAHEFGNLEIEGEEERVERAIGKQRSARFKGHHRYNEEEHDKEEASFKAQVAETQKGGPGEGGKTGKLEEMTKKFEEVIQDCQFCSCLRSNRCAETLLRVCLAMETEESGKGGG
eukprot:jgi/Bigna1/133631/aug1.22_g8339